MSAQVFELPNAERVRTPIAHVVRTGEAFFQQLAGLHAEGRLTPSTVIVDASKVRHQTDFLAALGASSSEIVLDTKCAELSSLNRCGGSVRGTPWAPEEVRPLLPADFAPQASIFRQIAQAAVGVGAHAVLSPSHFLERGAEDPWTEVDRGSVERLREALDWAGGKQIAIDLQLIIPHSALLERNSAVRVASKYSGLPFDNVYLRVSGFGVDASPRRVRQILSAVAELQSLGRPIILDCVGGLVAAGAVAFGYASGIAHGIGELERFNAANWTKASEERDGFGRESRIPVPNFDRSLSKADVELIAKTTEGRRCLSCEDRACCPHGFNSLNERPKAHFAFQARNMFRSLSEVPNRHRATHFLDNPLKQAVRKARQLSEFEVDDVSLNRRLNDHRKRTEGLKRMFECVLASASDRSPLPAKRRAPPSAGTDFSRTA